MVSLPFVVVAVEEIKMYNKLLAALFFIKRDLTRFFTAIGTGVRSSFIALPPIPKLINENQV